MISNVTGSFTKVNGSVELNESDMTKSQVDAVIDVSSVDTRVPDRDNDLRSPNFFDVAKYPTMEFKSKRITKSGDRLQMVGDLTLHGTTREVTLDVDGPTAQIEDPWGNVRRGFSATTTINRKDFGLNWNAALESGGLLVSDAVKILIEVQASAAG